jgi:UDPglucose--hexose-1-phosphate uridylyltransferase
MQLFENKGAVMGCSNPHRNCQVWASEQILPLPAGGCTRSVRTTSASAATLGDYLDCERAIGERLVCENEE